MDFKHKLHSVLSNQLRIIRLIAILGNLITCIETQGNGNSTENLSLQCWKNIQIKEAVTYIEDGVQSVREEISRRTIWTCCEGFHGPGCTKGIQESISKRLIQTIEETDIEFFLVDTHIKEYECPPNHSITIHFDEIQANIDEMKMLINLYQERLDGLKLEHGEIMNCNEIPFCPQDPSLTCVYISRCGEDRIAFIHNETFEYGTCPGVRDFFVGDGCDLDVPDCSRSDPCLDAACEGLNGTLCVVEPCTCRTMWMTESGDVLECPDPDKGGPVCETVTTVEEECNKRRDYFNRGDILV